MNINTGTEIEVINLQLKVTNTIPIWGTIVFYFGVPGACLLQMDLAH